MKALLSGAPVASVGIATPPNGEVFIGNSFNLTFTFDNVGTDVGYGPVIDVVLPTNGADGVGGVDADGLTTTGPATYLGAAVTTLEFVFDNTGVVDHPYFVDAAGAPLQVTGNEGDTLVVMQLPFGSFTADQPGAPVTLPVQMSADADLGVDLDLAARAGFTFGCDPLDNPATDTPIISDIDPDSTTWASQAPITPILARLTKTNLAPESETATGPNFIRTYEIVVEIAEGQTITDFDVTDLLPPELVYLGDATVNVTPALGEAIITSPPTGMPNNTPNNELTVRIPSVTGAVGNVGFTLTFDFYVEQFDADTAVVINPLDGDDEISENEAFAIGDWEPTDLGDPSGTDNVTAHENPAAIDDVLDDRSIAVQKGVANISDGQNTPGDILEYTLDFQVSDFFVFQDVFIEDLLSDGQRFDDTFIPELSFTENGSGTSTTLSLANLTIADNFSGVTDAGFAAGSGDPAGAGPAHVVDGTVAAGSQKITYRISDELAGRAGFDAILAGGCVPAVGTGGGTPDCGVFNGGATTGRITYRTVIQEDYSDDFPSGDSSVDQGDVLNNTAFIDGELLGVSDAVTPTGFREADGTGASLQIARGMLQKFIYAVNGDPGFASPVQVVPGDTITYRYTLDLPSSDVEDLSFIDYLPLPLLDAAELTALSFDDVTSAAPPVAGRAKFGPTDTFSGSAGISGIVPALIATGGGTNTLEFVYGDYDDPGSVGSVVDVLFTVTVSDEPFADGLFHTNQIRQSEGSTGLVPANQDAIIQIQINEPVLNITKGVVATTNPVGVFAPAATGPVGFSAPGTGGFRAAGTINSDGLDAAPINSDLSAVDAGDVVTFAIVLENTGTSRAGAFDVVVSDTLPAGFAVPGGGLNLSVTDGAGISFGVTDLGGHATSGLFGNGLQLDDPGATSDTGDGTDAGAIDEYDGTDGRNIVVVTYDLVVQSSVEVLESLTNTATLSHYAGREGGADFTPTDLTETAVVTAPAPTVDKTFVSTTRPHTTGSDVAIGEIVNYSVVMTVPEGTSSAVVLRDTLDSGLAYVDGTFSVSTSSANIVYSGTATPSFSSVGAAPLGSGRRFDMDFGTVQNTNFTTATSSETITVTYQAVVLNSTNNNRTQTRNNNALWSSSEGSVSDSAANVRIVEPVLLVGKTVAPAAGDAGDTFTVTLNVSHAGASDADAFDVDLTDVLPAGMVFAGSLTHDAGLAPDTFGEAGGTVTAAWASFPLAGTSTLSFDVTLTSAVVPGTTVTNEADVDWSSLPGDVTTPQSTLNTLSTERTGDPSDPGGSANDLSATGSDDVDITVPVPTKSIVSTSEAHTAGANLAVGEIVRYRLSATLPEGTSTNFQLVDALPAGLSFVDASQVRVSWTADNDVTEAADLAGADNDLNPPTFVLPAGRVAVAAGVVTFNLGTLVNNDNDAGVETITLEFNAQVENVAVNSTPQTHVNDFDVTVGGAVVANSNDVTTTLVEPLISNVAKRVVDIDTDEVTYEVTFSNTGTATAFDIVFTDAIPSPQLTVNLASVTFTPAGGASVPADTSVGNTVSADIASIPVGGSLTVRYTVAVNAPNTSISNTANVSFTSLPVDGSTGNPTGTDPSPGDERDGSGGLNDHVDSGTEQIGAIGNYVWLDTDSAGDQDVGEFGIGGVDVQLVWPGPDGNFGTPVDNVSLTTTTDDDGFYSFDGLPASVYQVTVLTSTLPGALSPTADLDGTATPSTATATLTAGQVRSDVDFGYVGLGSIGDTIFLDVDNDGVADSGEGVSGVTVNLTGDFDGDGIDEVLTTTTGVNGGYLFPGLPTNDGSGGGIAYTIDVDVTTLPTGVTNTTDPNGGFDDSSNVTLTDGVPSNLNQDFGYKGSGSVGDTIFLDIDNDGTPDADEGIANVTVTLSGDFDGDGIDEVLTTTTDNDGRYLFDNLVTNDGSGGGIVYTIDVDATTLPSGVANTTDPNGGFDDTSNVTLTDAVPTNLAQDFGYQGSGSIGDTIFLDVNNDGAPDPDEGIANVTVTLSGDFDGDGVDEVLTTATDNDGNYLFDNLVTNDGSGGGIAYTIDVDATTLPTGVTNTTDPNGGFDDSSNVTLTDAVPANLNQDFGYQAGGSIGDTIFLDVDNDGTPDSDEGIANVTVTLTGDFDDDGIDEVLTATTDDDGNYLFNNLVTNDGSGAGIAYDITVVAASLPSGVTNTTDPNGGFDGTSTATLTDGAPSILNQDFGYQGSGSIGDTIFLDVDNDGVADSGEGISGVTLNLTGDFDGDGVDEVLTTATDNNGNYLFDNLVTNDGSGGGIAYTIDVDATTLPTGVTNTTDPNGGFDDTSNATLTDAAPTNLNQDFGYQGNGSLGDTVFLDVDNDGVADSGEGISGVTVNLTGDFDGDGVDEVLTTTTDNDGNYLFDNLVTNDGSGGGIAYTIDVDATTLPSGVTNTTDPNGGFDDTSNVTLTDGVPANFNQDFGYQGSGSIGDTIFLDVDNDGTPDSDEGIANVTVTLSGDFDGDGVDEVLTTTTDNDGRYLFDNLVTNDGSGGGIAYDATVVIASLPAGVMNTTDPNGGFDGTSNAALSDGAPADLAQDFGYQGSGSIGNTIFLDVDNDGVADSGEGISGVTVNLTGDLDGDGIDEVLTTTTDSDGNYLFDNLVTNDGSGGGIAYTIDVDATTLPTGVTNTTDPNGGFDSTSNVTLTDAVAANLNQDFGYQAGGSIGDTIFLDVDNDGTPDLDEGIANVTVTLSGDFDGDGVDEVLTTATDNDGNYLFDNLVTNDGSGGGIAYTIDVDAATLPSGVANTTDPNGGFDDTSNVTLTDGAPSILNQDFGYKGSGSIGDTILLDVDNDGVADSGEGISGVTVNLTGDFDGDGVDEVLTTTTDNDGNYLFDNLVTNDGSGGGIAYTIDVDVTTLPSGVTNTTDPNGGFDDSSNVTLTDAVPANLNQDFGYQGSGSIGDTVFVDADNDGSPAIGEGVTGATVTLTGDFDGDGIDEILTTTTGADGLYNFGALVTNDGSGGGIGYTVDIDLTTLPAGVSPTVDPDGGLDNTSHVVLSDGAADNLTQDFGYTSSGSIGDTLFLDINGDGMPSPGEGITGVTVSLTGDLDGDGIDDVLFATTGPDGAYLFAGLPTNDGTGAGISYTVDVDTATLPEGVVNTVDPNGGGDNTSVATLTDGVPTDFGQDFGYQGGGQIGDTVFLDTNYSGLAELGEGLAGVTVTLTGDFDGDGVDEFVSTTTDTDGAYGFSGLVTNDGTGVGITYTISVLYSSLPAAYLESVDPDGGLDNQAARTLTDGDPVDFDQDFGYIGNGSLGDTIFLDANANRQPDSGEGISGVTVVLTADLNRDGILDTQSTITDADGFYSFESLPTNDGLGGGFDYTITVDPTTLPTGVINTSDPDTVTDNTSDLTLDPLTEDNFHQDFGYTGPGEIGDIVFLDVNGDGAPDPGEGISGVSVELVGDFDGDGVPEKVKTTTDADGRYLFQGLPVDDGAGGGITYSIKVDKEKGAVGTTLPAGVVNTTDPDGGGNGRSEVTLTSSDATDHAQDFGYMGGGAVGDTIFLDVNENGEPDSQEGIGGVTVELVADFDGDGIVEKLKTTTNAGGGYLFQGLPTDLGSGSATYTVKVDQEKNAPESTLPPGVENRTDPDGGANSRSAVVLTDGAAQNLDQDFGYRGPGSIGQTVFADVNRNGLPDPGEGLAGVTVDLKVDVDDDGSKETFNVVTNSDGRYNFENLPVDRDYKVKIDTSTLPPGMQNTSDPDGGTNSYSEFRLTATQPSNHLQDFGYEGVGEIGDTIFVDVNNNGVPDPGEGLTGVTVELVSDMDGDGSTQKVRTTTDANGNYLFAGLPVKATAGGGIVYKVKVDKEIGAVGDTVPAGLKNTVDPHKAKNGWSEFKLTSNRPSSYAQDFGYRGKGQIGDRVFLDNNGDGRWNAGEGIEAVEVSLTGDFDQDGVDETVTAVTDSDGRFLFSGLPRGLDYVVEVNPSTVPPEYIPEFDADGGRDFRSSLTLDVRRNLRQDFGFLEPVDLTITKDNIHPNDLAIGGEEFTYEIVVTNDGPGVAYNSRVVDKFSSEITSAEWVAQGSAGTQYQSAGSGDIIERVIIPAGGSIVYTVTANTDAGFEGTVINTARVKVTGAQVDLKPANNLDKDVTTVADMNVRPLDQLQAGHAGTLSSRGHSNDTALVNFYVSPSLGSTPLPGSGLTLGLASPVLIGTGFLCDADTIEAIWNVPEDAAGQTWYLQTVETTPTPTLSNVQPVQIGSSGSGSGGDLHGDGSHHGATHVAGHILRVTGTDQADNIEVVVSSSGVAVRVNGKESVYSTTGHAFHMIEVHAGAGADSIVAAATSDATVIHEGISIRAGDGDDTVRTHGMSVRLAGEAGDDKLDVHGTNKTRLEIAGNEGDDTITVHGDGRSLITGGDGSDTVTGGGSHDVIRGGAGTDSIFGNGGNDVIEGGSGDDVLRGGPGRDVLAGNSGDDSINGDSANDVIVGGQGADDLVGGRGSDLIVSGATAFDHDLRRMRMMRRTWVKKGLDYASRASSLVNAESGLLRDDVTTSDAAVDSIVGGPGIDLFFATFAQDSVAGLNALEELFDNA